MYYNQLQEEKTDRVTSTELIIEEFQVDTIISTNYKEEEELGFIAAWNWQIIEDQLKICGAVAFKDDAIENNDMMLTAAGVKVNNELVIRRLTFFNHVPFSNALVGETANCTEIDLLNKSNFNNVEVMWKELRL